MTRSKIIFQENCTAYRITTANTHYKTSFVVYPYYKVKRSENILHKINSSHYKDEMAWLTNTGSFQAVNDKGKILYDKDVIGRDYFIGYTVSSSLTKKVTTFENNNAEKFATIGWKIDFSESYISNDGRHFIKQDKGTFYDLMPQGGEVDLSTVAIQTEAGYLDASGFDVSTVTNYNGTGRTLLVVRLKEQFDYATLTYNLIYTWESVVDYGGLVFNSVAYETGNETVTKGFPDNGGTIAEASLLSDLDPDTDNEKFLYAEAGYTVNILITANSGLTKTVKNSFDHMYGDTSLVHQNGTYTYKIRYNTTGGITTDSMILFDSLENYSNEEVSSVWWGILQGVDTTQPEKLGAAPVIYYSSERLDITRHHDLTEETDGVKIWKTADEFGNIENARSVAVDLRKTGQGNDFIINDTDSVVVLLYMKAPPSDSSGTDDPKTYNGVYASYRTTDDINYSQQVFNDHGYSTVTLRIMADVNIRKVSTADNTTPIKGISFRLSGTSDYGTRVNQTLLSDVNGLISFSNIEKGTYTLTEVSENDEYLPLDTPIIVVIHDNGSVSYNGTEVMEGVYYTIGDVPRLHADISFYKRDIAVPELFVTGARFELTGTSNYGNEVTLYAQSDSTGKVSFPNVELGTYTMKETNTDSDHITDGNIYIVRVSGNEMLSLSVSGSEGEGDASLLETGLNGTYYISNEPYHSFVIQKEAYSDSQPVAGAVFELKGETTGGTAVDIVRTTNARGQISYTRMGSGIYTLQEISAPYGFGLDNTVRTVTIDKRGHVSISDAESNSNGHFVIINKENGSITIQKKWLDGLTNDQREANGTDAVIHLTTEKAAGSEAYFADSTISNQSVLLSRKVAEPITKAKRFRQWSGDDSDVQALIDEEKAVKVDNGATAYSIYSWLDTDGTVYWWSDAKNVYLTNGSRLFRNLSDCTVIDVSGLDSSKMTNMTYMFGGDKSVKTLDLRNLDTSNVMDMSNMFRDCSSLVSVYLRRFDTHLTTTMGGMFMNCSSLTGIDVSSFDTSVVRSMSDMFSGCEKLTALDVSDFDTQQVTNMAYMFNSCVRLGSVDVSRFDTHEVANMSNMFNNCQDLTTLELSSFDTREVTNMTNMFASCLNIQTLDLSSFDTHEVINMYQMFYNCKNALESIVFGSSFDTSAVTSMEGMFNGCLKLKSLDLSGFDTSEVCHMGSMFNNCQSLEAITMGPGFNTGEVVYMANMFNNCYMLSSLDLSSFDTSNVTTMNSMFSNCRVLTSFDLSNFVTPKVYTMSSMFAYCYLLEDLDVSSFDTRRVTTMDMMFYECSSLKELDLSGFVTPKLTTAYQMFRNCYLLEELDVSGLVTVNVTNLGYMFYNCNKLKELDLSGFETPKATSVLQMFSNCYELETLDISHFDTSNIKDMSSLFSNCRKLTSLDLKNFNTYNVTTMGGMFSSCYALTSVDLTNFYTANVLNMESMFNTCSAMETLDLSSFDTSGVTNMRNIFANCPALVTIYASNNWADKDSQDWGTYRMFWGDTKLVGGNGTGFKGNRDADTNWHYNCYVAFYHHRVCGGRRGHYNYIYKHEGRKTECCTEKGP